MTRICCVAAIAGFALFGQATGRLTGSVADATGAKIPGARVELFLKGGSNAVIGAATSPEGLFDFTALRADIYELRIEAQGFTAHRQAEVKIDAARETALPPIVLQVASAAQTVEITASSAGVQTTTFEVATTVDRKQIESLPVLDRQIVNLFGTQAGLGTNGIAASTLNGVRPSYTTVTIDGISVQDNWVRTNTLDFMPNRLTISQVQELTVTSSNANTSIGGGANQVSMITRSGSNSFHGEAYWYNRNNYFAANDWFNNQSGVARPFLNLNQFGGSLGGPIRKDKLLFHANYEKFNQNQQVRRLNRVLTPNARRGVFTYRDGAGQQREFNLLAPQGLTPDPVLQQWANGLPQPNNNTVGDGLNTAGYGFNARANVFRDIATGKLDYYLTPHHSLTGGYIWNQETVDRWDLGTYYSSIPPMFNDNNAGLLTYAWRWTVSPMLTNEVRGGYNRTNAAFVGSEPIPAFSVTAASLLFTQPVNNRLPEGRNTATYVVQDNANWIRGRHSLSFGYNAQLNRTPSYDFVNTVATYTLGLGPQSPFGYAQGQIPGLAAGDLSNANLLLSNIAGLVSAGTQSFNVTSATSGFVPGAPANLNWTQDNHAFYFSDSWKARRNLNLVLGVRWDYYAVVNERNSLQLQPVVENGDVISTLLGDARMDLYGNSVGRPFYKPDRNNFAPNFGFAWDPSGSGKTAIRGGYSVAFATDNTGNSILNTTNGNTGLIGSAGFVNASRQLRSIGQITPPAFQLPIQTSVNYFNTGRNNALGLVDPKLATPYVQQWSFGLQREWKGTVIEARYIGNHALKLLRQIDANEINVRAGGFLDDFNRARNNGFLAQAATGVFDPAFNAAVSGSQRLTVFPILPNGGGLNLAGNRGLIQRGEIGTLAQTYHTQLGSGWAVPFFRNPYALIAGLTTNISHSNYNAFQLEARRALRNGISFQASYVFSKSLTDANALRGRDEILENANFRGERARAPWDIRHAVKLNHFIPLPLGKGHRLQHRFWNPVIGDWSLSGFLTLQTGAPFSILSARGTNNRGARSANNTVDTSLTYNELKQVIGFYMTGNGPYFAAPGIIGPDGRGVAADGARPFNGQVFFNPAPGTNGSLNRRLFDGPPYRVYNFSLAKKIPLWESHSLTFRAEVFNLTNTPQFALADGAADLANSQNINQPSFGRISGSGGVGPQQRQMQFSLLYRF